MGEVFALAALGEGGGGIGKEGGIQCLLEAGDGGLEVGAAVRGVGKGDGFRGVAREDKTAFEGEFEAFFGEGTIGGQLDLAATIEGGGALFEFYGDDFGVGEEDEVGDAVDAEGFGFELALKMALGGEEAVAGKGAVLGQAFLAAVPIDALLDP